MDQIEDVLFRKSLDIATAASIIRQSAQEVQQGLARANQIEAAFKGLSDEWEFDQEDIVLRICFTRDATLTNLTELKKWGDTWFTIGRGIAMWHDASPDSIRIVGAKRGSFVLELAAAYAIVKTIAVVVKELCP